MPAKNDMSWEPKGRRWWKQWEGKRYQVSCRQLSKWAGVKLPETKEGSYQAANSWWKEKLAEINTPTEPHPHAEDIAEYERRRDWAQRQGDLEQAREWGRLANQMRRHPEHPSHRQLNRRLHGLMGAIKIGIDPESIVPEVLDVESHIWADRHRRDAGEPIPTDLTVGGQVKAYLDDQHARVKAGEISSSEFDLIRHCLRAFREWAGAELPIERIDADRWHGWYRFLLDGGGSVEYKKKKFRHARNLVEAMIARGLIQAPPNLHNRKLRFVGGIKAVPTMTIDEVQKLIKGASGQLKLHLLLMANCGMTQVDISDLHPTEVDWAGGRITRKRSKTGDLTTVPTVSYKLWPETLKLLKQYRSADKDRVLLTESGRPWVRDKIASDEGWTRSKTDAIARCYRHLQERSKIDKPLKLLRKTSATLLDAHPEFGKFTVHFLGHAPRHISERHYVTPSGERFDAAMLWLGQQYGFVPTPKGKPKVTQASKPRRKGS